MAEPARKLKPSDLHGQADNMLQELGSVERQLQVERAAAQEQIDLVVANYKGRIGNLEKQLELLDKALRVYAKQHAGELFADADRVELRHGALMHAVDLRVKRIRDMLERLDERGLSEAVKIARSVDWDVVEKWPDERLVDLGTERVRKDVYSYEVRRQGE